MSGMRSTDEMQKTPKTWWMGLAQGSLAQPNRGNLYSCW
jgi:hypothetical protein